MGTHGVRDRPATGTRKTWQLGACALLVVLVPIVGWLISSSPAINAWDLTVLQAVGSLQLPPLTAIAVSMNWLFAPTAASILIVIGALLVAIRFRAVGPVIRFLLLVLVPWLACTVVKNVVRRPRPPLAELPNHLGVAHGFSYPSGHTTAAFGICVGLAVVLRHTNWRFAAFTAAIVFPLLTAFARMYSGVHYLTDVTASIVLSGALVVLVDAMVTWLGTRLPALRF